MAVMKKEMNYFVQTRDVDSQDHMKPAPILDIFQDIAGLHADEIGVGYLDFKKNNLAWVVLYQKIEIVKAPPYLENVLISTWPKPKGRLDFEREYLMCSLDGQHLIHGISLWVVMDLNTRSLVRADKINYNGEYFDNCLYSEKQKRKLGLDKSLIDYEFWYEVTLDDLDHNGHMNNAKYLTIIYNHSDLYKNNKTIEQFEISYSKEAKYNDKIKIGRYKLENKEAFMGFIADELCFECLIGEK
ncbi:MAG: hypothetical protein K2I42_05250 [Anaeroplasmataceae bacterium]|nr:hypothetical protein [Anaeroplasmataceae bacterium]